MLKQRIITALILIPITLLVLFYLPLNAFRLLTAFIVLGAAWEWTNLMQIKSNKMRCLYLAILSLGLIVSCFILPAFIFVVAGAWWLIAFGLILVYPHLTSLWRSGLSKAIMGFFVLIPCWVAINFIRQHTDGLYVLLFLFVLIWGADSAAYFVGKKWGKTKLIPRVSPGKSWQGLLGALLFTCLLCFGLLITMHAPFAVWGWYTGLSLVTVIFSVIGDLFESMLKREAGLKDSGKLLPGHGGLLDRIDSLTAAAPIYVLGSLLLSYV